jgi:hypothetical protein
MPEWKRLVEERLPVRDINHTVRAVISELAAHLEGS